MPSRSLVKTFLKHTSYDLIFCRDCLIYSCDFSCFIHHGRLLIYLDLSKCDVRQYSTPSPDSGSSKGLILGVVFGLLGAFLLILVIVICIIRRRREQRQRQIRSAQRCQKEQLEELLPEIIKRSKKDEQYCKNGRSCRTDKR